MMAVMRKPRRADPTDAQSKPPDDTLSPELYRQIYVSLELPAESHPVIGVTSAIAGEGRTSVAVGLARTLAADLEGPTLLVEVDVEHPSLSQLFDLPPAAGLADMLRREDELEGVQLEDVMRPVSDNLYVITAGTPSTHASRLMRQLPLHDPFRNRHWQPAATVLDLPPILNHSYSALAASITDAVVLVVRAGVTPADLVREAIARLEDQPPRGVVLNGARSALPSWWPDAVR